MSASWDYTINDNENENKNERWITQIRHKQTYSARQNREIQ